MPGGAASTIPITSSPGVTMRTRQKPIGRNPITPTGPGPEQPLPDRPLSLDHARGLLQRATAHQGGVRVARQPADLSDLGRVQCLGPLRHGRQQLAVGERLVRNQLLQREPVQEPARPDTGNASPCRTACRTGECAAAGGTTASGRSRPRAGLEPRSRLLPRPRQSQDSLLPRQFSRSALHAGSDHGFGCELFRRFRRSRVHRLGVRKRTGRQRRNGNGQHRRGACRAGSLQSATQINFVVPAATASGPATIAVSNAGIISSAGTALVHTVAPGLFSANESGAGVAAAIAVHVHADGSQTSEPVFQCGAVVGSCVAALLDFGAASDQLYLSLFGTGSAASDSRPPPPSAARPSSVAGPVAQSQFAGLDQINLGPLPRSLAGRGEVYIDLGVDGQAANQVTVGFR